MVGIYLFSNIGCIKQYCDSNMHIYILFPFYRMQKKIATSNLFNIFFQESSLILTEHVGKYTCNSIYNTKYINTMSRYFLTADLMCRKFRTTNTNNNI